MLAWCPEVCAYPFAIPAYVPGRKPEAPPNSDPGMDGMLSVIAHELAEIASNPLANACQRVMRDVVEVTHLASEELKVYSLRSVEFPDATFAWQVFTPMYSLRLK
ncbi:protein EXORDIUM-like 3 [Hordeum vulgare]|nr:protein EXORDIUM-like 3 [Hordeum vulgare]